MADRTVPADRDKWIKFAAQPADLSNGLVGSGPLGLPFVDFNPCHN